MTITKLLTSAATIAALTFTAAPAFAQHRGGSNGGRSSGHAVSGHASSAPRSSGSPQRVAPQRVGPSFQRSGGRVVGSAAPRSGSFYRVAPRTIGPGFVTRGPSFYRPYYTFRPRVSLGFGLWAGYPVTYPYYAYGYGAYPYAYDPYYYDNDPYAYAAPAPYQQGYNGAPPYSAPYYGPGTVPPNSAPNSMPNSMNVQPGQQGQGAATGGLSFDISPATAEVIVDNNDIGAVSAFTPTSQPLALPAGRHHVELRAPGYETMVFDTDVVAGQVIPYQGTLQALRR